jgi:hypothetical protein
VEYELDDEDEQFLADLGDPAMDETVLELALDFLEKESFKQVRCFCVARFLASVLSFLSMSTERVPPSQAQQHPGKRGR